jgi:hypothetical protein
MAGKFRVKAGGAAAGDKGSRFCAGTPIESMNQRGLACLSGVPNRTKLFSLVFSLGRMAVITDNESS